MFATIDLETPMRSHAGQGATAQRPARARLLAFGLGLLGGVACAPALAQALTPPSGGSYVVRKQAIAGGGVRASGGSYVLTGTLGQALVDPTAATAASYRLTGGFHSPAISLGDDLFANGFEN
jgi:hypothetical protein